MITLAILSALIFHGYLLFVLLKYGPTLSISNTYYALPKKYNFAFTLYMWTYSILMLIPMLEMFGTPFIFLSVGAICFVGAAAAFREDSLTESVHVKSAFIAGLGSQLTLIFDFKYYVLAGVTLLLAGLIYYLGGTKKILVNKVYIYLAELAFFESIYIALFTKLLTK